MIKRERAVFMEYLKLLKNRNFVLLYIGQVISSLGSGINFMGITLYTLKFGGSIMNLGVLLLLLKLPSVIIGPIAGSVADRFNRKTIIIMCDMFRGIIGIILFFNTSINLFYLMVFLLALFDTLFSPAIGGFLPNTVSKEELVIANSMYASSIQISKLFGPALGGLLISLFSIEVIFILNGISFIISGISEMFIKYDKKRLDKVEEINFDVFRDIKAGVQYININKEVKFIVLFFALGAIGFGAFPILYVSYINNTLNASSEVYGLFMSVNSIGLLIGSILVTKILKKMDEFRVMIYGVGFYGTTFLVFAIMKIIPISIFLFFISGVIGAVVNISYGVFLQKKVENTMLGRVYSFDMALSNLMIVLVTIGLTLFGDAFRVADLIVIFSLFMIGVVVVAMRGKVFKSIVKNSKVELDF